MVPISIPLRELMSGRVEYDLYLPTEPILAGILVLFVAKLLFERKFDRKIALHPISIGIYINLFWILITCFTSTMPMVSFKFFIARLWFIAAFYFLASQLFKKEANIRAFSWLYVLPLLLVIGYTINRLVHFGLFNKEAANFVPNPFFFDHTSYGAALAFFLPVFIGFGISSKYRIWAKIVIWIIVAIIITALVFSYTRAAWVSIIGAIIFLILLIMGLRFKGIIIFLSIIFLLYLYFQTDILMKFEQTRQVSSANLTEHVVSIGNITSDDSNRERLNRWYCAVRMFKEKPFFGWGPGTYMFKYAPFQKSSQKTVISTNAGDMGNAHSEYFGPLAESGFIGAFSMLFIVLAALYTGIKLYHSAKNREIKLLILSILTGLVTYFIHGCLNNFLDTDKLSAPFWGFIAMLVALEVYHNKESSVSG
ncbi:MAG: O-antigen ligase family protein [Bacteroidia bacterium]|nr:O-antigen ligase family protein [Bacteroidia bacterium]